MDRNTAEQIEDAWQNRNLIDAVQLLRRETSMGLIDAKRYLEQHNASNAYTLLDKILEDFVMDPNEQLQQLRIQRDRLDKQIEALEQEIAGNKSQTTYTIVNGENMILREIVITPHGLPGTSIRRVDGE